MVAVLVSGCMVNLHGTEPGDNGIATEAAPVARKERDEPMHCMTVANAAVVALFVRVVIPETQLGRSAITLNFHGE